MILADGEELAALISGLFLDGSVRYDLFDEILPKILGRRKWNGTNILTSVFQRVTF